MKAESATGFAFNSVDTFFVVEQLVARMLIATQRAKDVMNFIDFIGGNLIVNRSERRG